MSELASMNANCDHLTGGTHEHPEHCPYVAEVIYKKRYQGEIRRVCLNHFVEEIGIPEIQDALDAFRRRISEWQKARATV